MKQIYIGNIETNYFIRKKDKLHLMQADLNAIKRGRSTKEVQISKNNFYFTILRLIKKGSSPEKISYRLQRSKQNIQYYISNLKRWGYIQKVGYGTWELTRKADYATSKKIYWGTQQARKKIELWRLGYRFYVRHDNKIHGLKEQTLSRGGKIHRGRVLGCWVMKGKEILDIYSTVSKSDNLWDAAMKALVEVIGCKGFIEDRYKLLLEPMEPLRPDIIINTPETRRIAEKVHEELGRLRTEFIDIDKSKTGQPEFEAKTLEAAQNTLDNLGVSNKADIIEKKLDRFTTVIDELREQISLHIDVMNNINEGVKRWGLVQEEFKKIPEILQSLRPEKLTQVEITEDTGDFYGIYDDRIKLHNFNAGAKVYLNQETANVLIKNGKAIVVEKANE